MPSDSWWSGRLGSIVGGLVRQPPDDEPDIEPPPLTGESPVETRPLSAGSITMLVAMVLIEIGLLIGLVDAILNGWGPEVPGGWARWPVWVLMILLFGAATWLYGWWLFHGGTVLTTTEVRDRDWLEGGRRILIADATSITLRNDGGSHRELVIAGARRVRFSIKETDDAWAGAVDNLRAWVSTRPDLPADDATRALLS